MGLLDKILGRRSGDEFYAEVKDHEIPHYQYFFERTLKSVSIENQTNWALGKKYDKVRLDKDDDSMYEIAMEAEKTGLAPVFLQIMVNQYFFADPIERELYSDQWAKKVVYRGDIDCFPSGWAVRKLISGEL